MPSNSKFIAELLNNSATVPDAKITQSSVTQHVTPTDLTPVKQDLALVAFDAIQTENRSALELPNSFVDQYEDANDIGTLTGCQRGSDEKIQSLNDTSVEYNPFEDETWAGSIDLSGDNTLGYTVNGGAALLNQMQLVVDIVILQPVKPQMQSMNLNFKSKGRVVAVAHFGLSL